jgi:hypothetical protein
MLVMVVHAYASQRLLVDIVKKQLLAKLCTKENVPE